MIVNAIERASRPESAGWSISAIRRRFCPAGSRDAAIYPGAASILEGLDEIQTAT
jgi:hypothetical protein